MLDVKGAKVLRRFRGLRTRSFLWRAGTDFFSYACYFPHSKPPPTKLHSLASGLHDSYKQKKRHRIKLALGKRVAIFIQVAIELYFYTCDTSRIFEVESFYVEYALIYSTKNTC